MVTLFIAKTESDLCPSFIASSPQPLLEYLLPIGHGGLLTVDTGVAEDPAGWLPWPLTMKCGRRGPMSRLSLVQISLCREDWYALSYFLRHPIPTYHAMSNCTYI